MSQHFLLSAKARTLSVCKVMELNNNEAFKVFKELRWGKGDEVACPVCGTIDKHYFKPTRQQWQCKDCGHTFSVTSGTIFAFHKLPLRVYLAAIAIFTNAVKGISALQLGRAGFVRLLHNTEKKSARTFRYLAPLQLLQKLSVNKQLPK